MLSLLYLNFSVSYMKCLRYKKRLSLNLCNVHILSPTLLHVDGIATRVFWKYKHTAPKKCRHCPWIFRCSLRRNGYMRIIFDQRLYVYKTIRKNSIRFDSTPGVRARFRFQRNIFRIFIFCVRINIWPIWRNIRKFFFFFFIFFARECLSDHSHHFIVIFTRRDARLHILSSCLYSCSENILRMHFAAKYFI